MAIGYFEVKPIKHSKNHRRINMDLHRLCTFSKAGTIDFNRKHMFQIMAVVTNIQFNISEAMEDILMVGELDCIRFPLSLDELPQLVPYLDRLYHVVDVIHELMYISNAFRVEESFIPALDAKVKVEDDKHNNCTEATYQRKFANILDILLEDEDITVYDGEKVSKDTQRIQILNENEDNGRKIDLLTITKYGDVASELCSIGFKVQDATIISRRSNSRKILEQTSVYYMDWKGREGYLVQVFQFKDIMVFYFVQVLYIPKNLMELNDFRSTLQYLYF